MNNSQEIELMHNDYTVGWVCALPTEQTASIAMLDHQHPDLPKPANDQNTYTLGSIYGHNIVVACLPMGSTGVISAATVATQMIATFPCIKFGVMVGIGGGIPPTVRLGDVVISIPIDTYPGVVQWDFGRAENDGTFKRTGVLNSPPKTLLTALSRFQTRREMEGCQLYEHLDAVENTWPALIPEYTRRDHLHDPLLVKSESSDHSVWSIAIFSLWTAIRVILALVSGWWYPDLWGPLSSTAAAGSHSVTASQKSARQIRVHYGLMASGNQVVKNAKFRNRLNEQFGGKVLCIEMEAAGLMNEFPCIVIRGICDYADAQKNDDWQKYASTIAAATAKELLRHVQASDIEKDRSAMDIFNQVLTVASATNDDVTLIKSKLTREEDMRICNWLSDTDYGLRQSDIIQRRHEGTGRWLLSTTQYNDWVKNRKQTLFCPGIPGAGKTVITSVAINDLSRRFRNDPTTGIAYLYCDYQEQSKHRAEYFLQSLLRQLSQSQPEVPRVVRNLYDEHKTQGTRLSPGESAKALHEVCSMYSRVYILVDALDECQASDGLRKRLLSALFYLQDRREVSLFVTSRFIPEIVDSFSQCLSIEIRASDEDVQRYLTGRIAELNMDSLNRCEEEIKTEITRAVDGMFLLAELHFESIRGKMTPRGIRDSLKSLPTGTEAYAHAYARAMERISEQSSPWKDVAINALLWITCANRRLNILELQNALAVIPGDRDLDEENLLRTEDIISACAGLVTIDKESNIIRLVHYTTQEYFLQSRYQWFPTADARIANICITYMSFDTFSGGCCLTCSDLRERLGSNPFYDYATRNWGHHARRASLDSAEMTVKFLENELCMSASAQVTMNAEMYLDNSPLHHPQTTGLHLAAHFGLVEVLMEIMLKGTNSNAYDSHKRTPLSLAATGGHSEAVSVLLADGNTEIDSKDIYSRTPLSHAAENGHEIIVKQLLRKGADLDIKDRYNHTASAWAAANGHTCVVDLLSGVDLYVSPAEHAQLGRRYLTHAIKDSNVTAVQLFLSRIHINWVDEDGQTPLALAAGIGHEEILQMMIARDDTNIDIKDRDGKTALMCAAQRGHQAATSLLLNTGRAEVNLKDNDSYTALIHAAANGHGSIIGLLVDYGAKPSIGDKAQRLPLSFAAEHGHMEAATILLNLDGVDLMAKDSDGQTAIFWAVENGRQDMTRMLLEWQPVQEIPGRAKVVEQGFTSISNDEMEVMMRLLDLRSMKSGKPWSGRTALAVAAEHGYDLLIKRLLQNGYKPLSTDEDSRTPLSYAAEKGHCALVKALLETGELQTNLRDKYGRTPFSYAAQNGNLDVALILSNWDSTGLDMEDYKGRTPFSYACEHGHVMMIQTLLSTDRIRVNMQDTDDRTPVFYAVGNGHLLVTKTLLNTGQIQLDLTDVFGRTPFHYAAESGYSDIVRMLLLRKDDFNVDLNDQHHCSALLLAAQNGHEDVIRTLLATGQININTRDENGMTPFIHAAWGGHAGIVTALLETGLIDPDAKDPYGCTPFIYAAENGHEGVVRTLLATGKINPNAEDQDGCTPFMLAAQNGHEEVLHALLETKRIDTNMQDSSGRAPLACAAQNGHETVVKALIEIGVDKDSRDQNGRTAFALAAQNGHQSVIRALLGTEVDINQKDKDGCTPFILAAQDGHETVVQTLLETGRINSSATNRYKRTAFSLAAGNGHIGVVQFFLTLGDIEIDSSDHLERTPFSHAAGNGHTAVILALLTTEAKPDRTDRYIRTPLSYAAQNGHALVVQTLLDTGRVQLDPQDHYYHTPLLYAAMNGHAAVVEILLSAGSAGINMKDHHGRTPFINAAHNGHVSTIIKLFETGLIEVDLKDSHGRSACSYAAEGGHVQVIQLLLAMGDIHLNMKDVYDCTPVFYAARDGHTAVVQTLLDTGKVDTNIEDIHGRTPCSYAAENGYTTVVKLLLDYNKP